MKAKLNDSIDSFDPGHESDSELSSTSPTVQKSTPSSTSSSDPTPPNRWNTYTQTNQLQRLTDYWREAKEKLPNDVFSELDINIKNRGRIRLAEYFLNIKKGLACGHIGVYYGGTYSTYTPYGEGFRLTFFDKHNNKIHLYVSAGVMQSSPRSHYIKDVLQTTNVKYFTVFILSPEISEFTNAKGEISITPKIANLRQLAIYLELNTSPGK